MAMPAMPPFGDRFEVTLSSLVEQDARLGDSVLLGWTTQLGSLISYRSAGDPTHEGRVLLDLWHWRYERSNCTRVRLQATLCIMETSRCPLTDLFVETHELANDGLMLCSVYDASEQVCSLTLFPMSAADGAASASGGACYQVLRQRFGATQRPTARLWPLGAQHWLCDYCTGTTVVSVCVRPVASWDVVPPSTDSPIRHGQWVRSGGASRAAYHMPSALGTGLVARPWCAAHPTLDAEALVSRVRARFDADAVVLDFDVRLGDRVAADSQSISAVIRVRRRRQQPAEPSDVVTLYAVASYRNDGAAPPVALTQLRVLSGADAARGALSAIHSHVLSRTALPGSPLEHVTRSGRGPSGPLTSVALLQSGAHQLPRAIVLHALTSSAASSNTSGEFA